MKKQDRLTFREVRPPRLPSIMDWKPTTQRAAESLDASEPRGKPQLELVRDAEPEADPPDTECDEQLHKLLSWPIVAPREDPPGLQIGLREV